MRKLDKGKPIQSFVDFVRKNNPTVWEEAKGVSREWREYILKQEQHELSGYTESPITLDGSHIDHFRKQSLFNKLVFDWNNYVVDSKDEVYGAKFKDNFIGTREENEKLINPVTEDANRFFKYEVNGRIEVADELSKEDADRALFTRNAFNLNEGSLVERRKVIMNLVLDSFGSLTDCEIKEALKSLGFTSVVEQLLQERKNK
jgi:uncharacterized protein (TIGR02646 family)